MILPPNFAYMRNVSFSERPPMEDSLLLNSKKPTMTLLQHMDEEGRCNDDCANSDNCMRPFCRVCMQYTRRNLRNALPSFRTSNLRDVGFGPYPIGQERSGPLAKATLRFYHTTSDKRPIALEYLANMTVFCDKERQILYKHYDNNGYVEFLNQITSPFPCYPCLQSYQRRSFVTNIVWVGYVAS